MERELRRQRRQQARAARDRGNGSLGRVVSGRINGRAFLPSVQVKEERAAVEPPRLSRHRFSGEVLRVLASDELSGSIRRLRSEGLLLKDRQTALQKRGVVEVRVRTKAKGRKHRPIVFTQGDRGERALERQAELDELIRANKLKKKEAAAGGDDE